MFDVFYIGKKPNLFAHERAVDSIEHAQELCSTRYFWIINYLTNYSDHDFLWEPVPWQSTQTHVWPSQHQTNGGTYLVPKKATINHNRDHSILTRKHSVPIVGIDHGNGLSAQCNYKTRFISDYLGTLKRVLSKVTDPYVWVISSVCEYSAFDFTWHPSEWQQDMLHVFASNEQKFGDTFYVHVPSFLEKTHNLTLLEWFDTMHFVEHITVPRLIAPVIIHSHDSHVAAIMAHDFVDPVVQFSSTSVKPTQAPTVNLWRQQTRAVTPLSTGAGSVLVPREAKNFIKTQLYDYPVIDKQHKNMFQDPPLDIVFIDHGEVNAEYNWLQLPHTSVPNCIHRSSGVQGRVSAYHAAARLSQTPWFFAVFAKLEVSDTFDWTWQPDRLQQAKHYIFHACNPVNGLVYGHQAMIAYNKNLVLSNPGTGLDFTLDSAHEVVPVVSGTANYYTSDWMCWRTAFREVLKLKANVPDVENQYRLNQWCTVDNTQSKWSMQGAQDAVKHYESVSGDLAELRKSYDWAWLASYAFVKHGLVPDQ